MGNFKWGDLAGVLSAGAKGWGVYQQSKIAKDLLKMQKRDYNEEKERKKRTQARLNLGADRAFGHKYDSAALPLAG